MYSKTYLYIKSYCLRKVCLLSLGIMMNVDVSPPSFSPYFLSHLTPSPSLSFFSPLLLFIFYFLVTHVSVIPSPSFLCLASFLSFSFSSSLSLFICVSPFFLFLPFLFSDPLRCCMYVCICVCVLVHFLSSIIFHVISLSLPFLYFLFVLISVLVFFFSLSHSQ